MKALHYGITCRSVDSAIKFYTKVLQLTGSESADLPAELINNIFGINRSMKVIKFSNEHMMIEVFIDPEAEACRENINHICLQTDDLIKLLERCRENGCEVLQIPKGDKTITFIRDKDGNLLEMKGS